MGSLSIRCGHGAQSAQTRPMARDPAVAKALTASCTLATKFRAQAAEETSTVTKDEFTQWRKLAVQCNKVLAAQERQLHSIRTEYETKLQMMKTELRAELIDREGNAARVADRQRTMIETELHADRNALNAFDRIGASVAATEAALNGLASVAAPSLGTSGVLAS